MTYLSKLEGMLCVSIRSKAVVTEMVICTNNTSVERQVYLLLHNFALVYKKFWCNHYGTMQAANQSHVLLIRQLMALP